MRAADNIRFALSAGIGRMENEIDLLNASITSSNPLNILSRGYVLVSDEAGRVVKSAHSAAKGDKFSLRFRDGKWNCEIDDII